MKAILIPAKAGRKQAGTASNLSRRQKKIADNPTAVLDSVRYFSAGGNRPEYLRAWQKQNRVPVSAAGTLKYTRISRNCDRIWLYHDDFQAFTLFRLDDGSLHLSGDVMIRGFSFDDRGIEELKNIIRADHITEIVYSGNTGDIISRLKENQC